MAYMESTYIWKEEQTSLPFLDIKLHCFKHNLKSGVPWKSSSKKKKRPNKFLFSLWQQNKIWHNLHLWALRIASSDRLHDEEKYIKTLWNFPSNLIISYSKQNKKSHKIFLRNLMNQKDTLSYLLILSHLQSKKYFKLFITISKRIKIKKSILNKTICEKVYSIACEICHKNI